MTKRRILISGGTGFIGGRLAERVLSDGDTPVIATRAPRDSAGGIHYVAVDGRDANHDLFAVNPDVVVHAAGFAGEADDEVEHVVEANLVVAIRMLEAASRAKCPFVGLGTFWQRSEKRGVIGPNSLYAATKDAVETAARFYVIERQLSATFLQLTDVYGPGDERGRLLAHLSRLAADDPPMGITAGEQVVSFVHVDDVVDAIVHVANAEIGKQPVGPAVFSVHGPEVLSLRSTISLIERSLNIELPLTYGERPYRPNEVLTPSLLGLPDGWTPRIGVVDGFRMLQEAAR